jgi:hypothetical protein
VAGPDDTYRDLSAVGDEDFLEHDTDEQRAQPNNVY